MNIYTIYMHKPSLRVQIFVSIYTHSDKQPRQTVALSAPLNSLDVVVFVAEVEGQVAANRSHDEVETRLGGGSPVRSIVRARRRATFRRSDNGWPSTNESATQALVPSETGVSPRAVVAAAVETSL